MKTVRDACQLQPNALSIKLSDQIEQLDELINAEGDGTEVFEKTYITQGMPDLISEGTARLAGVSSQDLPSTSFSVSLPSYKYLVRSVAYALSVLSSSPCLPLL